MTVRDDRPYLVIDPAMQFGEVCVPGRRIPASSLAEQVAAGDSVESMVADFDVSRDEVLLSCWWYVTRECGGRGKWDVATRKAWKEWAKEAALIFGGWKPGPCPDPPEVER